MEAKVSQGLQLGTFVNPQKSARKPSSLQLFQKSGERRLYQTHMSCCLSTRKERNQRAVLLKVSCCSQKIPVLDQGVETSVEESGILKEKSEEIEPHLNGRCIYLVGMMGSGKTTVGRILSEAIGYSFYDCDALIEKAVGGTSVAEIFKLHGESFFRDNETEVLHKLSSMHRLVVSTGGGAVIRPVNWRHMHKGISVWLDVPVEALARRIAAIGTSSRPLLHQCSGDPYTQAMKRLSILFKERGEAYENANARVSLENIALKLGYQDVCDITPTEIAIEALVQIGNFLKD